MLPNSSCDAEESVMNRFITFWKEHGGCTEDAQRMHGGCTEVAKRLHRGCKIPEIPQSICLAWRNNRITIVLLLSCPGIAQNSPGGALRELDCFMSPWFCCFWGTE